MAGTGTKKSVPANLAAKEEDREEIRRETERDELQDLNQGTATGTHDSVKHAVDWGKSYQGRSPQFRKTRRDEPISNLAKEKKSVFDSTDDK